jgi:ABC-type polysaccharide/polyol phosphate transport system ATPase subunit
MRLIEVKKLSKRFKVPKIKKDSFREFLFSGFKKNEYFTLDVLRNLNFCIEEGEFFGIVGKNGSGKSTLLKVLAGVYSADFGDVLIKGKIAPFLELGVGFNGELSAKENVFLSAAILGMSKKKILEKYSEIVEFAELNDFMEQKLKNFSSGMQLRLAFSIASQSDADIYLMDEVLAVGDIGFQAKCFEKFRELKNAGKTIVFVSHDLDSMRKFADRVLYLEKGNVKYFGKTENVLSKYISDNSFFKEDLHEKNPTNSVELVDLKPSFLNDTLDLNKEKNFSLKLTFNSKINYNNPVLGFILINQSGEKVFANNSLINREKLSPLIIGENFYNIDFKNLNLSEGKYYLTLALSDENCFKDFFWKDKSLEFFVKNSGLGFGIVYFEHRFS